MPSRRVPKTRHARKGAIGAQGRHRRRKRRTTPKRAWLIRAAGVVIVIVMMGAGLVAVTGGFAGLAALGSGNAATAMTGDAQPPAEAADPDVTSTTHPAVDPVGQPKGAWALTFADEFDGDGLDRSVWSTCYWWDLGGCTNLATDERQWYVPDQVEVVGGTLVLEADERSVVGIDEREFGYVSGMVSSGRGSPDRSTPPGFAFQYGYVEMRARVPAGLGLWPAFWLLPVTHDAKPEIDVMEVLGDEPDRLLMHIHWRDFEGDARNSGWSWRGPDLSEDWHVFGLDWSEDEVVWFVDGVERWRFRLSGVIPHEPMYLIANLAVGGTYAGDPVGNTMFPARYSIDYIRVWQRQDG